MPSKLTDCTLEQGDKYWNAPGVGGVLQKAYVGTVCFPLGSQFGCGSEHVVGVEAEQSIEATIGLKIGTESQNFGFGLKVATKVTKNEQWTHKSGRCEWCQPEICFPDSRVEVWTYSNILSLFLYNYDRTYFFPGPNSELHANCAVNLEKCPDCRQLEHAVGTSGRGARSESMGAGTAALIVTPKNLQKLNQETRLPAGLPSDDPTIDSAFNLLFQEGVFEKFGGRPFSVGVSSPTEPINWLYGTSQNDYPHANRLTLLSQGADEIGSLAPFRGRFLPVLAATQYLPEDDVQAEVSVTVTTPSKLPERFPKKASVRTGVFTLIWAELDFGRQLEAGTKISMQLSVQSSSHYFVNPLISRNYIVL